MKRDAKRPCPANPIKNQIWSRVNQARAYAAISQLPGIDRAPETLLQPAHAEKIVDADKRAIDHAVFRGPVQAGSMIDFDEAHFAAFAQGEGYHVTVHVVEIGKQEKKLAAKRFEAASRIGGAVVQHPAAKAIGEARCDSLLHVVFS